MCARLGDGGTDGTDGVDIGDDCAAYDAKDVRRRFAEGSDVGGDTTRCSSFGDGNALKVARGCVGSLRKSEDVEEDLEVDGGRLG